MVKLNGEKYFIWSGKMESIKKATYNYNMLNIVKLICAVLVVMIHTSALKSLSEDLWVGTSLAICRVAVPFFFIVSGFFFYNSKSGDKRKNKITKTGKLYFKLLLIETIILLPTLIVMIFKVPIVYLIQSILFTGFTGSLWYVSSMVIGMVFVDLFIKKDMYKTLAVIAVALFLFGLAGDSYYGLFKGSVIESATTIYKNIFIMMQVGFTASVPFLTIGIFINKLNLIEKIKNPGRYVILGLVFVVIEAFILFKTNIAIDYNLYFSLLIFAPALFIFAIKSDVQIDSKKADYTRSLGVLVYVLHQPLMLIAGAVVPMLFSNTLIKFIIVILISILVASILIKLKVDKFLGIRE